MHRFPLTQQRELFPTLQVTLSILFLCTSLLLSPGSLRAQAVLLGDQSIETQIDSNATGTAEAFQTTATASGTLGTLSYYLDASNGATKVVVGIYADANGDPGALLTQGSSTQLTAGAWNTITVPQVSIASGTKYWIAILGGQGGTVRFRDRRAGSCISEASSQSTLAALPTTWGAGTRYTDCPLSAYGTSVSPTQPILSASPANLNFSATQGGLNPQSVPVSITNAGAGTLNFTVSSDSSWLGVSPGSGAATATLQVSVDITGLAPATYVGHVTITSSGTQGSPATVTATLVVASPPPPPTPILSVSPATLSFVATQGGSDPPNTTLNVTNAGSGSLNFTASSDSPWLGVSPLSGAAPAILQVSASVAGLAPNTYTGHLTITTNGVQGSPISVMVTFIVSAPAPPGNGDWVMVDHDPARTGTASDETTISTSNVANLQLAWSTPLDGKVTAQPLFLSGVTVGGQTRDVLVAATNSNSVYALDAASGSALWQRNFGASVTSCGAIPGGFGISGAPLVDRTAGLVYVVSDDGFFRTLALADGNDAAPAVSIIPNRATNKVSGGLNQLGTNVYITTASDGCDGQPWRGVTYRMNVSGTNPVLAGSFATVPSVAPPNGGGGIWGYGGVSIDPATGQLYAASGADSNEGYTLYADRLFTLDSNLNILGSYAPSHPSTFPCNGAPCDVDFGATPLVFTPPGCPTLTTVGNKNGHLYLFRAADLAASGQPLQDITLNIAHDSLGSGGVGGVPAYWSAGNMVFITNTGPGVTGISAGIVGMNVTSSCTLQVAWSAPLGGNDTPNSTPTLANGVVLVGEGNGGRVHAYNAATGAPLWDSGGQIASATFAAPVVARGTLYVGSWDGFAGSNGGTIRAFRLGTRPPTSVLLGDQAIESQVDSNTNGTAEAFATTSTASGTLASITFYLDATSTATGVTVGVYADNNGHPGALLSQASTSTPAAGAWNTLSSSPAAIATGNRYWMAILGTGNGTVRFRDRHPGSCASEASSQSNLTNLPASWTTGTLSTDCPLSVYGVSVQGSQPALSVSPATLSFTATQGGSNPAPASVSVSNVGTGTLNFTASSDMSWLVVLPTNGTAPQTLQISPSVSGLVSGTYIGHITIAAAGAQGSPATVTVTLTVNSATLQPVLSVSPTTLTMTAPQGTTAPATSSVNVTNSGGGTLSFSISSDAAWLSVTPATGSAPQILQVSASPSGLLVNTYTGHLTITAMGAQGSPATVTVTFNVAPPPPPQPTVLIGDQAIETQLDSNPLGRAEAFQATASASGTLGSLTVYLDSSSTATGIAVGLYANGSGHPGTLLTQGSSTQLTRGAWNKIAISPVNITAGTVYWITILGTQGGTPVFRDRRRGGCSSETSSQSGLNSLPATWATGTVYTDCPLSGYGSTP